MKIPQPSPDAIPNSTSHSGPDSTAAAEDGDLGHPPNLLPSE